MNQNSSKINMSKVIFYIITISYALIAIMPFIWSFYSSFRTPEDVNKINISFKNLSMMNYKYIFTNLPIGRYYLNSVIVAAIVTVGNLLINSMAGYAFARLEFAGKDIMFMIVLGIMMIPGQVLMVPTFVMLSKLNWLNSFRGLTIPFLFSSFYIFMMRQFFMSIPKDLEEAAFIDGMSRGGIFFKIALPLVKPALSTQAIGLFIGNWNAFLWPSLIATKKEWFTLPVGLGDLEFRYFSFQNQVMAGTMCLTIPIIIMFLVLQKYIIENSTTSGMK
ncbi:carbohydrate ABC transporter membrane protein 2, CUT1 family [Caloramator quimbayensis]|uniref:Carbohydrate ABC transporter membrane protein 2, CUT1 family n=1 Tax=Caloramator quimbayensis TaxID=1147123 RepID=A0A1T4WMP8_9CLOT|nr:carbohydrate ABC transporter permease [Caloramator quimbayensis]SKA78640.1 carbohydrate ABC transporter membrane protein 2, CUT1 family [Caloramator quimbayensis]